MVNFSEARLEYEPPEITVCALNNSDVIRTSVNLGFTRPDYSGEWDSF